MMQTADLSVDTRGLNCPLPLLRLKKALQGLDKGQTVWVQATDPASVLDFGVFVEQTAHVLLEQRVDADIYHYLIRKG
ncbi:MAG: sulfurtransferase TusA family protein [Methylococcaceae bacterium]